MDIKSIALGDFGPITVTLAGTSFQLRRVAGELHIDCGSGGVLSLPFQNADGFLQTLFGVAATSVSLPSVPSWSSVSGFALGGSSGSRFTLPMNTSIGLVTLRSIELDFEPSGSGFALTAGANGTGTLGPLSVVFQGVGIRVALQTGNSPGEMQLSADYLPPTGFGLSISAGPVLGGGFLSLDASNGRYAAVLELSLFGISVKGFALVDTHLPGGARGFSFLVLVFADFESIGGIQLGLGFVLTGVGGVFGIFRSVSTDSLRSVVLSNNLDHLLFPPDPIHNAAAIISDLRDVFPPASDEYVFGPFARLGWGTPVIVEAELGFVLDVPRFTIAILGIGALYLPIKPTPVIEVHMDLDGVFDPGQSKLEVTGSLHDSRILTYTLSGQMDFLLTWGEQPSFLFSLGGFNPHFVPPPGVPSLQRLRLDLGFGDNPRISMLNYIAVTSNTFQFGANCELYAAEGPFNVHGWIGFDALFSIAPLYFIVDFSAGIDFRKGNDVLAGVHLSATLSGPGPWHAEGSASISILFVDASVSFSATIGSETSSAPSPPDRAALLAAAVSNTSNWSALLPPTSSQIATIAKPDASEGLLLDPMGGAAFREHVLPLDKVITRFAAGELPAPEQYKVQSVGSGGVPFTNLAILQDNFAVAQFEDLSDQDKLSQPSFSPMDAGFSIAADIAKAGNAQPGILDYYTDYFESSPLSIFAFPSSLQSALTAASPSGIAGASRIGLKKYAFGPGAERTVSFNEASYSVVSTADLSPRPDISGPASKSQAYDALRSYVSSNPGSRELVQIIPTYQASS